jgi:DNA modification methylase
VKSAKLTLTNSEVKEGKEHTDFSSHVEEHLHTQTPLGKPIQEWRGRLNDREWRVFNGPAKETLRLLPRGSIHCVVTSPPYFWLRDYKVEGQLGLDDSVNGYVVGLTDVMAEVYRVLDPEGVLFLNLGDTYYSGKGESQGIDRKSSKRRFGLRAVDRSGGLGIALQRKSTIGIPWRVAIKMCEQNWILRSPIIWNRRNCLPEPVKDRPMRGYEFVFMFVKSRKYFFNRQALPENTEDVWTISARPKLNGASDTAPFPEELVEQCLAVGCKPGGAVLDPFCGSGTTLRVALRRGHNAIGIDLKESFCKIVVSTMNSR